MSLKHQFSTLIGFTEAEFKENYIDIIKFYCEEDYVETELENIKSHYNGYKFSVSETENRLISPVSVIRHLKSSLIIFQSPNHKNEGILVFYYYFHNFLFLISFFSFQLTILQWSSTGPTGKVIEYYEKCFHDTANEKLSDLLLEDSPTKIQTD